MRRRNLISLRNLPVAQKMALVCALFVLPALVALSFGVSGVTESIHSAKLELAGNQYQAALEKLLDLIPRHHVLTARARTLPQNANPDAASLRAEIDAAFANLADVDRRVGETLQFTPEGLAKRNRQHAKVETLTREWQELKAKNEGYSRTDADRAHFHLVADLRIMITHAGDTSNLILDPDLDSYYLMDATLLALPQNQDRISAATVQALDTLSRRELTQSDRVQFAVLSAMLKEADLERILAGLQTALNEDPNFHGSSSTLAANLQGPMTEYSREANALIAMARRVAESPAGTVSPDVFAAQAAKARQANFRLWHAGAAELDALLLKRIADFEHTRWMGIAATSTVLLLASGLAWFISRLLVRPLRETVLVLDTMAKGDFTGQLTLDAKDEMGRMAVALNLAISRIRGALLGVRQAADDVAQASSQLSEASTSMAASAQEQAAGLEETSASLEQITSTVRQSAKHAKQASTLGSGLREAAGEGGAVVKEAMSAMSEINGSSRKIADIIGMIDEFAFQTNLLALNAAVEAARAGEHGRGFAVVAAEVRALAQRSATAAKEIKLLVQDSVDKVGKGSTLVKSSSDTLSRVVSEVNTLVQFVDQISHATEDQSLGIEQVNKSTNHMDRVTQSSAAQTEQVSATATELSQQADRLRNLVARFVLA